MTKPKRLLLLGNNVSPETAEALCNMPDTVTKPVSVGNFESDEPFSELFPKEEASYTSNAALLKGMQVVITQSTDQPVSDNAFRLLFMIDTARRSGAGEIVVVQPFSAFGRQDRDFKNRFVSVGGDLWPRLLKEAGADRVITLTPHSRDTASLYRATFGDRFIPLSETELFAADIKQRFDNLNNVVIGAPDGADKLTDAGQERARNLITAVHGKITDDNIFLITKEHTDVNATRIKKFEGDVAGKDCVVIDDMISGGGTVINASSALKSRGARSVTLYMTHAILSGNAYEKILSSLPDGVNYAVDKMILVDTIPSAAAKLSKLAEKQPALAARVEIISAGAMLQAAIMSMGQMQGSPRSTMLR